ncbi:MAG: alpha/beta hydrolase [Oligoflexales bacterium]
MKMKSSHIGDLEILECGEGENCIVIFHGYGASSEDLAALAQMSGLKNTRWIFPNGCLAAPGGFGRAWFPIDANRMLEIQSSAQKWFSSRPVGLDMARDKALQFLSHLNHPLERLVLGGFSQGAMLACDLAFTLPPVQGLAVLSGSVLDRANWSVSAGSRQGGNYWQSHGRLDEVLPYQGAEQLHQLLVDAGWKGEFKSFDGGHEIPPQQLQQFFETLKKWFVKN